MIGSEKYDWSVCIMSSRENASTLLASLRAAYLACGNKKTLIDVVINGNLGLATDLANSLSLQPDSDSVGNTIRIWNLSQADKATAWNTYLYDIWVGADLAFFIDGYVMPWPDAMMQIEAGLANKPETLGSTGIPTMGRSAKCLREDMLQNGGIHGNLFAIKGEVCLALKESKFFLPVGIYRTDPTIGATLAFNLDPRHYSWNIKERILVNKDVSWSIPEQNIWSLNFCKSFIKRRIRQAQGQLENLAVRQHFAILKKTPEELPRRVDELIDSWIKSNSHQAFWFFLWNPLSLYAFFRVHSGVKNLKLNLSQSEQHLVSEGFYNV